MMTALYDIKMIPTEESAIALEDINWKVLN